MAPLHIEKMGRGQFKKTDMVKDEQVLKQDTLLELLIIPWVIIYLEYLWSRKMMGWWLQIHENGKIC